MIDKCKVQIRMNGIYNVVKSLQKKGDEKAFVGFGLRKRI